jgi:hypothetical protein
MTPETNADNSWDRVAAELRACREEQHRAWGDIDNTTLGRFLAGEVTPEEQNQIENALDALPELRKLTDLVRDVLGETENAIPPSPAVPYGPAVLPFPQPQLRAVMPRSGVPVLGPSRERKPWGHDARIRQRAGLAVAACLLLALGVALPTTSNPLAERGLPFDPDRAVAMVGNNKDALPMQLRSVAEGFGQRQEDQAKRVDASVQILAAKGQQQEAESLARRYISNWTRQARVYQANGDLARAEPALNRARLLCTQTLGPDAPETVRTRKSLAGMYVAALNAPAPASNTLAANDAPLHRSTPMMTRSLDDGRRDMPKLMMAMRPASVAVSSSAPPSAAVRSSSGYVPPESRSQQPNAQGARYRFQEQQSAVALRRRITHQNQSELRLCVVPVLVQALGESKTASERRELARALGQLGPAAADAVPALLAAYRRTDDVSERVAVLSALAQIGPSAGQAAPLLIEALHGDDLELRRRAATALVRLGPAARSCRKDLADWSARDPLIRELLQRLDSSECRCGIDDAAGCFSVESLRQGCDAVLRLAKTAHLEVRIETVADPAALKQKTDAFQRETRPNGVRLCLGKEPASVQVFVSDELQKQGLSATALQRELEPPMRARDFDGVLQTALRFLDDYPNRIRPEVRDNTAP